jgi:hypothetical protein
LERRARNAASRWERRRPVKPVVWGSKRSVYVGLGAICRPSIPDGAENESRIVRINVELVLRLVRTFELGRWRRVWFSKVGKTCRLHQRSLASQWCGSDVHDNENSDLTYFTHEVDGRLYGGWYRLLDGGRIEVLALCKIAIASGGSSALESAKDVLMGLVHAEKPQT